MNKINCITVDDETDGRIVLKELCKLYCPNIEFIAEASNITDAYNLINITQPDLVFLDIQMPGGDGFELLKKFDTINFDVIFVTSFDKYAINAIKFSALDYLLKPIDVKELINAIEKVKKRKAEKDSPQRWVINLLDNLDEDIKEKKIIIHHRDKVKLLPLSSIVCLQAESNYTHIYTCDKNEKYTPARVLKDFEEYIKKHDNFIRINKGVIINLNYVKEYSKGDPCTLFLKNEHVFEISRRKKTKIIEKILNIK